MKIALLGYGKMGKEIESIALGKGHEIVLKINSANGNFNPEELKVADVAIEFSRPDNVLPNIEKCFLANVPVVIGTTGWYEQLTAVREKCIAGKHTMLYASNFSVGVNIFFELNKRLAELMNPHWQYEASMEEIHHTQKLDSPSGTAITLAEGMLQHLDRKKSWVNHSTESTEELPIISKRIDNVPGTHIIRYSSPIDDIEISHTAHNRKGFAAGAVLAAEWLQGKTGVFTMKEVLNF